MKTKLSALVIVLFLALTCSGVAPYVIQLYPTSGDNGVAINNAINAFSSSASSFPQGGRITLAPGIYHIQTPITFNATFPVNFAIDLEGSGSLSTAIVQDTSNNVVLVTGSGAANGAGLRLRQLTIAESTNASIAMVNLQGGVSTLMCDDVNFVWWTAWTNQTLGGPNWFKTGCTLTNNLVGITGNPSAFSPSDLCVIQNCGFFGLACAIDAGGFDHLAVEYCKFYFCPSAFTPSGGAGSAAIVTNAWPVGSPYRTGAAIVMTSIGDGNTDRSWLHNHFFGCNAAFLVDQIGSALSYRPQVSIHDQFENLNAACLLTYGSVFNLENPQFQLNSIPSLSKLVRSNNGISDPNSYVVEDVGEQGRTGNLQSFWQRVNFNGMINLGGLSVLPVIPTNVSGIILTNGDLSGANVLFTNPVAGHTAGTVLFTNAAFGGGVLFDPNKLVNTVGRFDVYLAGTDYGGIDPWGVWPVNPNYLLAPGNNSYPWGNGAYTAQFNGQQWFSTAQTWNQTYGPDVKLIYTNTTPSWQVALTNSTFSVSSNSANVSLWPATPSSPGQIIFVTSNTSLYVLAACNSVANIWGSTNKIAGP